MILAPVRNEWLWPANTHVQKTGAKAAHSAYWFFYPLLIWSVRQDTNGLTDRELDHEPCLPAIP
jgi:hypothetical protein